MKVVTMQQITYNNQEATLLQTRDKIILAKSEVYLTYVSKVKGYQGSDSAYLKIVGWEVKKSRGQWAKKYGGYLLSVVKEKVVRNYDGSYSSIPGKTRTSYVTSFFPLKVIDKKGETWENVLMELLL